MPVELTTKKNGENVEIIHRRFPNGYGIGFELTLEEAATLYHELGIWLEGKGYQP